MGISRIEAQRCALEIHRQDFESFGDRLKRAKDRATFDRFMAEHPDNYGTVIDIAGTADHPDHRPG
ncbi:hypothetical protein AO398_18180 [Methylobacterium sp. GXS13]|uniref:DUF2852 domain-containing protein n=1 Tax=Methylobacterium sp. GXS13 TaxID=1730094 RepID=UPI00071B3B51|nr:DUF2852 domain-containing protein [Methylobacterium sp. GXS13]KST59381.1 hypothetical protein AO398_18180 [Methylobacterium sp. GXS13]